MLTLGSLFDGIGGFMLAGQMAGIKPVWSSEIEPFPLKVTAARFPDVRQLGSVTNIDGAEIEPVDIITFGSPCQDLSVAGKQAGIHDGARSSLFFEAIRIIREMRNADRANGRTGINIRPRFAVWENVPGAFGSHGGEDFRAVIQAFADICQDGLHVPGPARGRWNHAGWVAGDGWSLAWRVYDAQYWGVPQRRRRIYLIADFAGERAAEILFKPESLRGNIAKSKATREGTAADTAGSAGRSYRASSFGGMSEGVGTLRAGEALMQMSLSKVYDARGNGTGEEAPTITGDHQRAISDYTAIVATCQRSDEYRIGEVGKTLAARDYKGGGIDYVIEKRKRRYIVRRLTPTECARLQGFPDDWCKGLGGSDTAIYKAYGNGIALPCTYDVLQRIADAYDKPCGPWEKEARQ